MTVKRLTIRCHLNAFGGYGLVGIQLFEHFTRMGIYVSLRPITLDEKWGKSSAIPLQMRAQIVQSRQPEPWELLIGPPDQPPTPDRRTVQLSMFESTQLTPQYVSLLARAEHVVVPCRWNARHFKASGVTRPISVVPLGYDPKVFSPQEPNKNGPLVIGVSGRTCHCAARKNVQAAIDLFLRTFPNDDGVRLHVKIHHDDKIDDVKDHRIKVVREHFEPYQIANWMRDIDVFLTLSRAEGYGLWGLQALVSNRPVIGCRYSGQADYMTDANSFCVPFREVSAQSGESNVSYLGEWADPDLKEAQRILTVIRRNRSVLDEKRGKASACLKLTWENTAKKLHAVLENLGVFQ